MMRPSIEIMIMCAHRLQAGQLTGFATSSDPSQSTTRLSAPKPTLLSLSGPDSRAVLSLSCTVSELP